MPDLADVRKLTNMPVTAADLLTAPNLDLRALAGGAKLDAPLLWVYSSDLSDPTPFLARDHMLLTTGTQFVNAPPGEYGAYVRRLIACGVHALGFGTEVVRDGTPPALIDACLDLGLPLIEVPYRTPFIAIIRWAADRISDERFERDTWALQAQRAITKAALRPSGASAALRVLSTQLQRGVVLFDDEAAVRERYDSGTTPVAPALDGDMSAEVLRLLRRGKRASSTFTVPGSSVSLQTLGRSHSLRGVLAVVGPADLDRSEHAVISGAIALIEISLERNHDLERGLQSMNEQLLALLQDGMAASAQACQRVLAAVGRSLPAQPLRVLVVCSPQQPVESVANRVDRYVSQHFTGYLVVRRKEDCLVIVSAADASEDDLGMLASSLEVSVGAARSETYGDLTRSIARAATEALRVSVARGGGGVLMSGDELHCSVSDLIADPHFAAGAQRRLSNLLAHDQAGKLINAATAWLDNNGQWEPAARQLGMHRHTLKDRLGIVATLADADLATFAGRAELWAMLQALPKPGRG